MYKLLISEQHMCSLTRLNLHLIFERGHKPIQVNINDNILPFQLIKKKKLTCMHVEISQRMQRVFDDSTKQLVPARVQYGLDIRSPTLTQLKLRAKDPDNMSPHHELRLLVWSELPALLSIDLKTFWAKEDYDPLFRLVGQLGIGNLQKISVEYTVFRAGFVIDVEKLLKQLQREMPSLETVVFSGAGCPPLPQILGLDIQVV